VSVPCQIGGGVRDEETIARLLELGASRLVVGTRALREPEWFRSACQRYPRRLVLGIDAREGRVATHGWLETSDLAAPELARQCLSAELAAIVYTDIATDGMLAGPNLAAVRAMRTAVDVPLIASGGVTTAEDVSRLRELGVAGCIIGRALYEGRLTLEAALTSAEDSDQDLLGHPIDGPASSRPSFPRSASPDRETPCGAAIDKPSRTSDN